MGSAKTNPRPQLLHLPVQVSAAGDKDMALKIYQSCNSSGKIIGTLAEKGDFQVGSKGCHCSSFFPMSPRVVAYKRYVK
jgi:hypothetical protein